MDRSQQMISTYQDESFKTILSFLGQAVPILEHIEFCVGRNGPSWAFWTGPGLFVGLPLRNYYIPIITFQEENFEPNLSILDQP